MERTKDKSITEHDLLKCLQENQALLKTILTVLEEQTEDPINASKANLTKFEGFIREIRKI